MGSAARLRPPVALAAVAVAAALAGCATAPSGGPPRRATGGSNQVQAYVQPLPPPGPTTAKAWDANAVVLGFLHASASYAFDPAAAERYLVPALRKSWRPGNKPVAVVGAPHFTAAPYRSQILPPAPGEQLQTVKVSGQELATLSQTGEYKYKPGQNVQYDFVLAKDDGVWRIQDLPQDQTGLLLTQADFEAVYQARNLFFFAPPNSSQAGLLVPDPVYAPLQSTNSALNTNLATGLVNGLLKGQGDWLSGGATVSAFPPLSHLIGPVTITGRVARVDLGGGAVQAIRNRIQVQNMEEQLQATLGDRSYSEPLASQVQLYINNKLQYANPVTVKVNLVTDVAPGPVFIATSSGTVGQLAPNPAARAVPTEKVAAAQIGRMQITAIAAGPPRDRAPEIAIAVRNGTGCTVYLRAGGDKQYKAAVLSTSGGACTSLSWDNNGHLWAAAGQAVFMLQPPSLRADPVDVTQLSAIAQSGSQILAFRMAPDGVRAALLVRTKAGNKLLLAAVRWNGSTVSVGQPVSIGVGGADPAAISWSDPYHLAVLAGDAIFEVPLTGAGLQPGGTPQSLGTAPPGAQTLTTDGYELVAGTADGHIFASSLASPSWSAVTTGSIPVYPG